MLRRCRFSSTLAGFGLAWFTGVAAAQSPDDARVLALIETLRPLAAAIVVDGSCDDWGAIPLRADPAGDAGALGIAPLDDALLVRIELAGTPPAGAAELWIEVDYRRQQFWDLKLSLAAGFAFLDYFPESGEGDAARSIAGCRGRASWRAAHPSRCRSSPCWSRGPRPIGSPPGFAGVALEV